MEQLDTRKRLDSTSWLGINPEEDLKYLETIEDKDKIFYDKYRLPKEGEVNSVKRSGTKLNFVVKPTHAATPAPTSDKTDGKSKKRRSSYKKRRSSYKRKS